jgi:hypothetical protein
MMPVWSLQHLEFAVRAADQVGGVEGQARIGQFLLGMQAAQKWGFPSTIAGGSRLSCRTVWGRRILQQQRSADVARCLMPDSRIGEFRGGERGRQRVVVVAW